MRRHRLAWIPLFVSLLLLTSAHADRINGNLVVTGHENYCFDVGTVNAYACPLLYAITNYTVGATYRVKVNSTNTLPATLNLNGLGTKPIRKYVAGVLVDVTATDICNGEVMEVKYDGTSMQLLNPPCNAPAGPVTGTIASGTTALAQASIPSGGCATIQTATATGALSTDVVIVSFNARASIVTGFTAATTGTLRVDTWLSTNTMNIEVCNGTLNPLTPGAISLNWRVVR